jgi:hypothetical protein
LEKLNRQRPSVGGQHRQREVSAPGDRDGLRSPGGHWGAGPRLYRNFARPPSVSQRRFRRQGAWNCGSGNPVKREAPPADPGPERAGHGKPGRGRAAGAGVGKYRVGEPPSRGDGPFGTADTRKRRKGREEMDAGSFAPYGSRGNDHAVWSPADVRDAEGLPDRAGCRAMRRGKR